MSAAPAKNQPPVVLCLSGHDPAGGAGIQADIEAIASLGAHAATSVTCVTEQDSLQLYAVLPIDDLWFERITERLVADLRIDAIKLGVIASPGQAKYIACLVDRLRDRQACPLIVDPVLAASHGGDMSSEATVAALLDELIPRATLLTPNLQEAQRLTGQARGEDCAADLLRRGAQYVLLTGGDQQTDAAQVEDRLYYDPDAVVTFRHDRLALDCHGSGCSLAAACAALLAADASDVPHAVQTAVAKVSQWLGNAHRPGRGQHLPLRR